MKKQLEIRKSLGILILSLVIGACLLAGTNQVFAQTDYTMLQPLPLNNADASKTDAGSYLEGVFVLAIGIAGVLTVIMIIWGGIQYMSTDAISGKSEAKSTIQQAIWGLLLAIGAWLILNTISPNLVNFNLNLSQPTTEGALYDKDISTA